MKIWAKLMDRYQGKNRKIVPHPQFCQVREWHHKDKDIPKGFVPEHGFVTLHDPATGDYVAWCGINWARQRIVDLVQPGLPTKFQHTSTNTEPVYKHCRKYEIV